MDTSTTSIGTSTTVIDGSSYRFGKCGTILVTMGVGISTCVVIQTPFTVQSRLRTTSTAKQRTSIVKYNKIQ